MRRALTVFPACLCFSLALSCGSSQTSSTSPRNDEANSAAGKLGQAAHKFARQADKAAQSMGKEIRRAAHDAHEGWKEEDRKSAKDAAARH